MQGETVAASGYDNAAVAQPADADIAEAVIDAFANLATVTSVDQGVVATLTDVNSRITKQLEENAQALKEIRALLKKGHNDRGAQRPFTPSTDN
jgi:glycosylphosphatidylinositol transamidase (GPIT) subunit GPI8